MKIIDKHLDYWDHLSKIYGEDNKIVYDRRGSSPIDNADIVNLTNYTKHRKSWFDVEFVWVVLEIGFVQYLLELKDITFKYYSGFNTHLPDPDTYDCTFNIVRIFNEQKHYFATPISINQATYHGKSFYRFNNKKDNQYQKYVEQAPLLELVKFGKEITNPILKGTGLTSILGAKEIWSQVLNYISSLNNEKTTNNQTDIEKVVSHGFDKKTSFRG